jgi:hypothetical protein
VHKDFYKVKEIRIGEKTFNELNHDEFQQIREGKLYTFQIDGVPQDMNINLNEEYKDKQNPHQDKIAAELQLFRDDWFGNIDPKTGKFVEGYNKKYYRSINTIGWIDTNGNLYIKHGTREVNSSYVLQNCNLEKTLKGEGGGPVYLGYEENGSLKKDPHNQKTLEENRDNVKADGRFIIFKFDEKRRLEAEIPTQRVPQFDNFGNYITDRKVKILNTAGKFSIEFSGERKLAGYNITPTEMQQIGNSRMDEIIDQAENEKLDTVVYEGFCYFPNKAVFYGTSKRSLGTLHGSSVGFSGDILNTIATDSGNIEIPSSSFNYIKSGTDREDAINEFKSYLASRYTFKPREGRLYIKNPDIDLELIIDGIFTSTHFIGTINGVKVDSPNDVINIKNAYIPNGPAFIHFLMSPNQSKLLENTRHQNVIPVQSQKKYERKLNTAHKIYKPNITNPSQQTASSLYNAPVEDTVNITNLKKPEACDPYFKGNKNPMILTIRNDNVREVVHTGKGLEHIGNWVGKVKDIIDTRTGESLIPPGQLLKAQNFQPKGANSKYSPPEFLNVFCGTESKIQTINEATSELFARLYPFNQALSNTGQKIYYNGYVNKQIKPISLKSLDQPGYWVFWDYDIFKDHSTGYDILKEMSKTDLPIKNDIFIECVNGTITQDSLVKGIEKKIDRMTKLMLSSDSWRKTLNEKQAKEVDKIDAALDKNSLMNLALKNCQNFIKVLDNGIVHFKSKEACSFGGFNFRNINVNPNARSNKEKGEIVFQDVIVAIDTKNRKVGRGMVQFRGVATSDDVKFFARWNHPHIIESFKTRKNNQEQNLFYGQVFLDNGKGVFEGIVKCVKGQFVMDEGTLLYRDVNKAIAFTLQGKFLHENNERYFVGKVNVDQEEKFDAEIKHKDTIISLCGGKRLKNGPEFLDFIANEEIDMQLSSAFDPNNVQETESSIVQNPFSLPQENSRINQSKNTTVKFMNL